MKQWEYRSAVGDRDRIRRYLSRTISHLEILSGTLDDFRGYKEVYPERDTRIYADSEAVDTAGFKAATGHTNLALTTVKAFKEHYESQEIASLVNEDMHNFGSVAVLEENARMFSKLCRGAMFGGSEMASSAQTEFEGLVELQNKFSPEYLMKCLLYTVLEIADREKFVGAIQPEQLEQVKKAVAEVEVFPQSLTSSILAHAQSMEHANRIIHSRVFSKADKIERLQKVLAELEELNESMVTRPPYTEEDHK